MAYELREVLDTVRMTEMEHFDIRTVTLGVSLRDCSSVLPQTVRARVYDKIRRTAAHHVTVAEEVEALYGVQIANKRVSVTPIALIADSLSPADLTGLAQILDTAAEDVGIDYLAGFSALVERGLTRGDEAYLEALPRALATTKHVCASINCGSTTAGINGNAVLKIAEVIRETARLTAEHDSVGCARLVSFCNAVPNNPFIAGAFHGPSEPEAVINVGISGPGVVLRTSWGRMRASAICAKPSNERPSRLPAPANSSDGNAPSACMAAPACPSPSAWSIFPSRRRRKRATRSVKS